ncbi:sulfatase [Glaciecola sp. HTCC2999]|jgi:arylsulfatase A-like enzyme|uniref:sulfatase family protein n=1 Tax=Glaciecola sp. HTCC2999 TaxID=455436 RepID=UPI0000E0E26F|nr:sulfatase [Glaciecola sp. HTCC2999]
MKISSHRLKHHIFTSLSAIVLLGLTGCGVNSTASTAAEVRADTAQTAATERPNILFILADDHRWDMLGKYHPIVKTPNLDTLANNGTVFKNAFVTTPICATSRVSILTGLTERTHDYTFQQPTTGVVESANMYPNLMRQDGYETAFVGKYEMRIAGDNAERFDYFKPLLQARTEIYEGNELPQTYYIAELANDFIEQSSQNDKPWTMSVNFWNPHAHDFDTQDQFHYPEEFAGMYDDVVIPPARLSDDEVYDALPEFLKRSVARDRWKFRFATPEMYQKMVKRYYRAISSVDKAVGMIYDKLEAVGQADNTVIIYMGDNGFTLNERQLAGKWFGWDEALRVPLIIYDPRVKASAGNEINEFALNIDIPSTILALAGTETPESYQGESLLPLLYQSADSQWRNEFFFEHMYQPSRVYIPPTVGIRTNKWKYVDFYKNGYEQLYDLENDAGEEFNLIDNPQYRDTVQQLSAKVDDYIALYESQRSKEVKSRKSFINVRHADSTSTQGTNDE